MILAPCYSTDTTRNYSVCLWHHQALPLKDTVTDYSLGLALLLETTFGLNFTSHFYSFNYLVGCFGIPKEHCSSPSHPPSCQMTHYP